jgi:hypothetical protein
MISEVFFADRPRPELRDRLGVFQPLIGSWSLIVDDFEADGTVGRREGEWHFGWALDGRALVDVWICPSRAAIVGRPGTVLSAAGSSRSRPPPKTAESCSGFGQRFAATRTSFDKLA